jgi:hypothetical protein
MNMWRFYWQPAGRVPARGNCLPEDKRGAPGRKLSGTSVEKLGTHLGEGGGGEAANNRGSEASLPIV